jgi:hypothetical protein
MGHAQNIRRDANHKKRSFDRAKDGVVVTTASCDVVAVHESREGDVRLRIKLSINKLLALIPAEHNNK